MHSRSSSVIKLRNGQAVQGFKAHWELNGVLGLGSCDKWNCFLRCDGPIRLLVSSRMVLGLGKEMRYMIRFVSMVMLVTNRPSNNLVLFLMVLGTTRSSNWNLLVRVVAMRMIAPRILMRIVYYGSYCTPRQPE